MRRMGRWEVHRTEETREERKVRKIKKEGGKEWNGWTSEGINKRWKKKKEEKKGE